MLLPDQIFLKYRDVTNTATQTVRLRDQSSRFHSYVTVLLLTSVSLRDESLARAISTGWLKHHSWNFPLFFCGDDSLARFNPEP